MIYMLLAILLSDLLLITFILFYAPFRAYVLRQVGVTRSFERLRMDLRFANDEHRVRGNGLAQTADQHWSAIEAIVAQLNSNTQMLRGQDKLLHHWALANPQLMRVAHRLRAEQRLTLKAKDNGAGIDIGDGGMDNTKDAPPPPMPGEIRCDSCQHPELSHTDGPCRVPHCGCTTLVSPSGAL